MEPPTMRVAIALLALLAVGCQPASSPSSSTRAGSGPVSSIFDGTSGDWIDLTYPFSEKSIYWPTDTLGFRHEKLAYGKTDGGWFYSSWRYSSAEHGGTHLDAPIHFGEGKRTLDAIPLSSLMGPAAVVDVSDHANPDYLVSVDDLANWEKQNGQIPEGAIVLVRTGW